MSHKLNGDDQAGNEMKHNHHRRHRSDIDRYIQYIYDKFLFTQFSSVLIFVFYGPKSELNRKKISIYEFNCLISTSFSIKFKANEMIVEIE